MAQGQAVFEEINRHLLEDEKPSVFLSGLAERPWFRTHPFSMLSRLMETHQSPKYHPEGNVWNHTMLVVDAAARMKNQSSHAQAFMWAALLHDIGKPDTTKTRKGKITSYRHETLGATLSRQFLNEFGCGDDLVGRVASLVKWHMQILFVNHSMPFANIPAMKRDVKIHDIALLGLCDRLGRLGADMDEETKNYERFLRLVSESADVT